MMDKPALTIGIPNFNYAHFLPETLDSVLAQDFKDYEILIIDDCSTDNSRQVIESYEQKDKRIRSIFLSNNQGALRNFELGLKEARGKYFQFLAADDLYLPGYLSSLMGYLISHPEVGFACSSLYYFQSDQPQQIETIPLLPNAKSIQYYSKQEVLKLCQTENFWIPASAAIAKIELIHKHGGYHFPLENIGDWYLFNRMALFEGVAFDPKALFAMRKHQNSMTSQVKKNSSRRSKTYWALLQLLSKKNNREARKLFKQSTLLIFVVENLFWRLLFCPKYWAYFPPLREKVSIRKKLQRSLKKRFRKIKQAAFS